MEHYSAFKIKIKQCWHMDEPWNKTDTKGQVPNGSVWEQSSS